MVDRVTVSSHFVSWHLFLLKDILRETWHSCLPLQIWHIHVIAVTPSHSQLDEADCS